MPTEIITKETIPHALNKRTVEVKLNLNTPHTHYSEINCGPSVTDMKNEIRNAQYSIEQHFINNTYKDILIVRRSGLATVIQAKTNIKNPILIIREVITLKSESLLSTIKNLASIKEIDSNDLLFIKKTLEAIDTSKYMECNIILDFPITVDDIEAGQYKSIYHFQSDILLAISNPNTDIEKIHPYSTRFLNIGCFGRQTEYTIDRENFNLRIKYVDHDQNASPKYINLGGIVLCLYPTKDAPFRTIARKDNTGKYVTKTYPDYLEILFNTKNDPTKKEVGGLVSMKYTIEEAQKAFGLYPTYIEALNNGDQDVVRKKELSDAQYALEVLKQKIQNDKAIYDQDSDDRKAKLNQQAYDIEVSKNDLQKLKNKLDAEEAKQKALQVENEKQLQALKNEKLLLDMQRTNMQADIDSERAKAQAQLKAEQAMWEDYYHAKQANRKDTMDLIKFIPGLIIGIAGIIGVYVKMNGKSD